MLGPPRPARLFTRSGPVLAITENADLFREALATLALTPEGTWASPDELGADEDSPGDWLADLD